MRMPNTGGVVIVVNHGITLYFSRAVHLMLCLRPWTDSPYCEHHSDDEFVLDMFLLAKAVKEGSPERIRNMKCMGCVTKHARDPRHLYFELLCTVGELFLVFHELAHLCLGHLNDADVTVAFNAASNEQLPIFNRSQVQELNADTFALEQLFATYLPSSLLERDITYGVGCLFALIAVVDALSKQRSDVDTHPAAADRWRNVRSKLTEPPGPSVLDAIDCFFEGLAGVDIAE
jgi:hypothetical protein